jgi:transcriptional regulator of acetoin/glycerol metabolism
VGSGRTHSIKIRLVAATHRDLTKMVARNEFRSVIPVLRQRLRRAEWKHRFREAFHKPVDDCNSAVRKLPQVCFWLIDCEVQIVCECRFRIK